MKKFTFLLSFLIPVLLFGQTNKYQYSYRLTLKDFPSYSYFQVDPSIKTLTDTSTQLVSIQVLENGASPIPFAAVRMKFSNGDSLWQNTNIEGFVKVRVPFDNFYLTIRHPSFTYLNDFVPLSSETRIIKVTSVLGKSFRLVIPILRSIRPLTETEVIEIINDLSNDKKSLRLVEDKTCTLTYEI